MHEAVTRFVAWHASREPVSVLDIGGRDVNGTNRDTFPWVTEWFSVDLREGPAVDLVADAAELNLGRTFDVVICTEVLEHAERWRDIVARAAEHLSTPGQLIITCAAPGRRVHSGITGSNDLEDGEYYANVSADELRAELEAAGLEVEVCWEEGDDTQAAAWKI